MHLVERSDLQALRRFALTMVWAFPLFFSLLLPWLFSYAYQLWPLLISAALGLLYVLAPSVIYYPYCAWMSVAGVIGWINTRLILGFTFFAMIWPIGLVLRRLGKLQYQAKRNPRELSYYVERTEKLDRERLERPF